MSGEVEKKTPAPRQTYQSVSLLRAFLYSDSISDLYVGFDFSHSGWSSTELQGGDPARRGSRNSFESLRAR